MTEEREVRAPARVLVVEDDGWTRELLAELLDLEGYAVGEAASSPEALWQVRHERPDAVLLDLRLAWGSGEDVLHELKASAETRPIPVILMSAALPAPTAPELVLADGAVPKPLDIGELCETLARALHGAEAA